MTKISRFDVRIAPKDKALVARAAKKAGISIAAFIRNSVIASANAAVAK